ncbi:MAG: GTP-binding protein EngB [Methanothrix sp.]|nr:GTP-binding protein EngB [Methanothrix sp.]
MSREIVLIGRSNVGKSTLFWELTGTKVRVGKRPGITKYPFKAKVGDIYYVDMPGYGFMLKASRADQEKTKDLIVQYFEQNAQEILLAIQVIDAASFLDIADRWEGRGEVPFEVELWEFLSDMGLDVVLAANKMDRIAKVDVDGALDLICERLGMMPPWTQWTDKIAPMSAKRGQIQPLRSIIGKKLSGKKPIDMAKTAQSDFAHAEGRP